MSERQPSDRNPLVRRLYTAAGLISLGLGVAGAFLPVLPTTPFLLLAAACFMRGSKRLHGWLLNHPRLGPYIRNYMEHRAIPRRTKIVVLTMLWVSIAASSVIMDRWWLAAILVAIASAVTFHVVRFKTLR